MDPREAYLNELNRARLTKKAQRAIEGAVEDLSSSSLTPSERKNIEKGLYAAVTNAMVQYGPISSRFLGKLLEGEAKEDAKVRTFCLSSDDRKNVQPYRARMTPDFQQALEGLSIQLIETIDTPIKVKPKKQAKSKQDRNSVSLSLLSVVGEAIEGKTFRGELGEYTISRTYSFDGEIRANLHYPCSKGQIARVCPDTPLGRIAHHTFVK